ncbi:MAG: TIGR04283 family arsenosugar biosynthesis glycosyltransferase [Pseudomonadaceae bacterium]|nr:TIGR04283 family arsenosugar biosynthesis glycosyltransferase [Pseudomonadaceae bacterium]
MPNLSIVIPVLNDAGKLFPLLETLAQELPQAELIVVDGGSEDLARADLPETVCWGVTEASRGKQLQQGAQMAKGDWLWLLHADSTLQSTTVMELTEFLLAPTSEWGRFDVAIDELPIVSWFTNTRSAITHICTGDQGIFVAAHALSAVGGVPDQPLMEDIELSKRLKGRCPPARLSGPIITSSRRWRRHGVVACILQMWWFRLRYWAGVSPAKLAAAYYRRGSDSSSSGEGV